MWIKTCVILDKLQRNDFFFFKVFVPFFCVLVIIRFLYLFLAQLSRCACTITFHKPYIASLEIWMIGLWTIGPFDYNLIQMNDYRADSCAISPTAFLLIFQNQSAAGNVIQLIKKSLALSCK